MLSTKPYLIRAIHEWCSDQGFTPYLAVQVDDRTCVPREFVNEGQIVLNISTEATHHLSMGNEEISFQTRFNGASFPVKVPVETVLAIYARENGLGMAFEATVSVVDGEEDEELGAGATASPLADGALVEAVDDAAAAHGDAGNKRGGHLTLVK
jgi:stringent starvation protein B